MLARTYWGQSRVDAEHRAGGEGDRAQGVNAPAHLWLADSRRQLAAVEKDRERQRPLHSQAREDYRAFLTLTNYSTNAANWLS